MLTTLARRTRHHHVRCIHASATALVHDPLQGKKDGLIRGNMQPRVEYGRGCAVRPGCEW